MLGLAAGWSGLLALLPPRAARVATPYLLFVEIMTVGTLFAGALTVTDRSTGATAALAVSPARAWERVTARLAPLAALTTISAVPVLIAGRRTGQLGAGLVAIALTGLLLLAVAAGVAAGQDEFVGFMVALSGPMVLLFAVPLAVSIGLLTGPLWYVTPTTGTLALLRGDSPYPAGLILGYLALWAAVAVGYATGRLRAGQDLAPGRTTARVRPLPARPRWLVFPRADLRNITRDSMLAMVALSPLLLAIALRLGYPPLAAWLQAHARSRSDALFAGTGDARGRRARPRRVRHDRCVDRARRSRGRHARRRADLAVRRDALPRVPVGGRHVLSAAGLAVAAPLSGLVPASATGALLLAVLLGPLMTLATLAVARSRVQGATADKVLALPAYLPIAAWWLTGPVGWLLVPFPTYWIVRCWSGSHLSTLLAGAACAVGWLVPLVYRVIRRLR